MVNDTGRGVAGTVFGHSQVTTSAATTVGSQSELMISHIFSSIDGLKCLAFCHSLQGVPPKISQ